MLHIAELCREIRQFESEFFLGSGKVICPAVNFALHCKDKSFECTVIHTNETL